MLERIVLKEKIECPKRDKVNMTAQSKMTFLEQWRKANAMMLLDGGLSVPSEGVEESKFFTGIIFSPSYCKNAVPELQDLDKLMVVTLNLANIHCISCMGRPQIATPSLLHLGFSLETSAEKGGLSSSQLLRSGTRR